MAINSRTPRLTAGWDLQLGPDGSLLMADGAYGIAQNISCACKSFKGGLYFYADRGIPWFSDALAQRFRKAIIAARVRETAAAVPGVKSVDAVNIDGLDTESRTVSGEVLFTTTEGINGRAVIR